MPAGMETVWRRKRKWFNSHASGQEMVGLEGRSGSTGDGDVVKMKGRDLALSERT